MKPDLEDRKDPAVLGTLTTLAHRNTRQATPEQLRRGWSVVSARFAAREVRRKTLVSTAAVAAGLSVLVVLVFGILSYLNSVRPAALAYKIHGGSVVDGGYLRELGNKGITLAFSEGSEFVLMPGTRGRLRAVDGEGARIAIENGAASFQVTPRTRARWLVDVGPFLVTVTGTVFTVSWDAAAERFELRLQHGQVSVTGPIAGGAIPVRAGQRLVVNLPKEEIVISEQTQQEAWPGSVPSTGNVASAELPTDVPVPIGDAGPGDFELSVPAGGKSPSKRAWAEAAASGDWDKILGDVDRIGTKQTLVEVSSEELFILSDAARYRGRTGLAREALLAERTRFPGTRRAVDAIFLLGRLEEFDPGGTRRAIARYEEYLTRAPTGTYASEALGRKMIATRKLQGIARAKPLADEYLMRFPNGTYAGAARAVQQAQ